MKSWPAHKNIHQVISPVNKPLIKAAALVRGNAQASCCNHSGSLSKGKNIPLTQNIGSTKRVKKLFIAPIVVAVAVRIIAMDAKVAPMRNAAGIAKIASGESASPNVAATTSTAVPERVARVEPHRTSPATMSSGSSGVKSIAS